MESIYKLIWSDEALKELGKTLDYLKSNWPSNVISRFSKNLDQTLMVIQNSPEIFPLSEKRKTLRKAVIDKHNILYYRIELEAVYIISIFATKRNPKNKNLK